jgi:hypothetical protein
MNMDHQVPVKACHMQASAETIINISKMRRSSEAKGQLAPILAQEIKIVPRRPKTLFIGAVSPTAC